MLQLNVIKDYCICEIIESQVFSDLLKTLLAVFKGECTVWKETYACSTNGVDFKPPN